MRFEAFGKRANGKLIKARKSCTSFFISDLTEQVIDVRK